MDDATLRVVIVAAIVGALAPFIPAVRRECSFMLFYALGYSWGAVSYLFARCGLARRDRS